MDFADIVNQSEPRTRPLYIHFTFRAQSKAVHTFVHTDVGKDRLDNAQSPGVDALSLLGVDLGHRVDGRGQGLPALFRRHTWEQKKPEATKNACALAFAVPVLNKRFVGRCLQVACIVCL